MMMIMLLVLSIESARRGHGSNIYTRVVWSENRVAVNYSTDLNRASNKSRTQIKHRSSKVINISPNNRVVQLIFFFVSSVETVYNVHDERFDNCQCDAYNNQSSDRAWDLINLVSSMHRNCLLRTARSKFGTRIFRWNVKSNWLNNSSAAFVCFNFIYNNEMENFRVLTVLLVDA